MCCYRELEIENSHYDTFISTLSRMFSARRIQRRFRLYYTSTRRKAAVDMQRWYRGRRGFLVTMRLRIETHASRRLHHWARARLRRRNAMARRIQRWPSNHD